MKYTKEKTEKSVKKPAMMQEDAGGLTVCKIDWQKAKNFCQFCKEYHNCTTEKREACLDLASNECIGFKPIHPETGGERYTMQRMVRTEKKEGILYSDYYPASKKVVPHV